MLRIKVDDVKLISGCVGHFKSPVFARLQVTVQICEHFCGYLGAFKPSCCVIRQSLAILVRMIRAVKDIEEITRHGKPYSSG